MEIFLETSRLILRQFTTQDVDNLFQLDSDIEVIKFTNLGIIKGGNPIDIDYATICNRILPKLLQYYEKYNSYGFWAAIEKASSEFIGWFHLRPASDNLFYFNLGLYNTSESELGYRLCKTAWGKGYATEGAKALVDKGFLELGTQRVVSMALATHTASIRVMQKVGLKFVGKYMHPEIAQEVVKYALNKNDWQQF